MRNNLVPSTLAISRSMLPGNVLIVALEGALDAQTGSLLAAALAEAERSSATRIIIDLARVSFISSAGIGSFISTAHALTQQQRSLHLAQPSPAVREVFTLLGLTNVVPVHAHVIDAIHG